MTVQQELGVQKEPIAIIGSGCRFPGNATSPSALWDLLCNPTDLTKEIPDSRFSTKGVYHPDGEHHGASNVTKAYLLEQDPRLFDSVFFNIAPREAEAIDPQQRLVLETVYEAMEDSGLTLGNMRGSPTGCYVGVMTGDYAEVVTRDPETFSKYMATGTSRALISNRVSYVLDWRGPSMTVDTACSSSLVAVDMAVKALRGGEVTIACAAGSNLILNADTFIGETNLHMISVDGQSKMWDQSANGYARGEGVAAIFLKTLSQALKDGDRIDAIIRETGVNQDGRTQGITLPNPEAQAALIRSTYRRAGLDIDNPNDRCQYFEAHGTGTQAGDPREASAIKQAFFPGTDAESDVHRKLYVGSIKTVIGHTEGCAGVAGLLKAALALKHKTIPPNQHFNNLNPSVAPSYANLCVPTAPTAWPSLEDSVLRRASVNSFGFGGTNAHAIVEAYDPKIHNTGPWVLQQRQTPPLSEISTIISNDFTPLPITLSANSNTALIGLVEKYVSYLGSEKGRATSLHQVAATLQSRRSSLPFQTTFAGPFREQLLKEMSTALKKAKEAKSDIGQRLGQQPALSDFKILGVFTGQGAQWPTMGASLLRHSEHFRHTIAKLDASLQELPDAPEWTLAEELAAPASSSRVREAAISQPACTALQVALVDLLKTANISFHTVIGHSSGEIGAAYAAGFISGTDAVRIAYYRGVHAKFAGGKDGQKGSMIAVGWGIEQAREFCSSDPQLNGRLAVAASNSPGSVTLSGDEEAVLVAKKILDTQGVFNRVLLVDTAYHSHHMLPCSQGYLDSLKRCNIQVKDPAPGCTWISSVRNGSEVSFSADKESLQGTYWRDNMVQTVLFSQAVEGALASTLSSGSYTMGLEIGPHPALKGPVLQTIKESIGETLLYEGVLDRKRDDVAAFASALGSLTSNLAVNAISIDSYANAFFSKSDSVPEALLPCVPVGGLPAYAWDYRFLWRESRVNKQLRSRSEAPQELLGVRTTDDSEHEPRWRNILTTEELPWLKDHRIQGQIVVPGAIYCAMALEAAAALSRSRGDSIHSLEIHDLDITKATAIDDASEGCETIFSLHSIEVSPKRNIVSASFSITTGAIEDGIMRQVCKGSIRIHTTTGSYEERSLQKRNPSPDYLIPMSVERFYSALGDLGLNYTGPFRAVSSLERTMNRASAVVAVDKRYSSAAVHPSWLDVSFQIVFAAFAATNDGSLWSAFVPTKIGSVKLVVPQPGSAVEDPSDLMVDSTISHFETAVETSTLPKITADIEIFDGQSGNPKVSIRDMTMTALTPSTATDDRPVFQHTVWKQDILSGVTFQDVEFVGEIEAEESELLCDQFAAYCLKSVASSDNAAAKLSSQILSAAQRNEKESATLRSLKLESVDLKLIAKAAKILVGSGKTRVNQRLQHQLSEIDESFDSLLSQWHVSRHSINRLVQDVTHTASQIAHKHPRLRILLFGAHSASVIVPRLIAKLDGRFSTLTILGDEQSEEISAITLQDDRVSVVAPDSDVLGDSKFDFVLLSDPFKATDQVQHARQLLCSGGFLLLAVPDPRSVHVNFLRAIINWEQRRDTDQAATVLEPVTLPRIHKLLRDTGYTGIVGSSERAHMVSSTTLIVSQATDSSLSRLIQPFHSPGIVDGFYKGDLVIIGGSSSLDTLMFAESLHSRLAIAWKGSITHMEGFAASSIEALSKASLVISLSELEEPTFNDLDKDNFSKIQRFFKTCKTIQYVINTSSSLGPYHAALVGLGRTVTAEDPDMMLQFVDVDALQGSETSIAEAALRLAAGRYLARDQSVDSHLWTNELELAVRNGKLQVPRVILDQKRNDAINSVRRVVEYDVSTKDTAVSLARADTHLVAAQVNSVLDDLESSNLVRVELCVKSPIITGNGGREQYLGFGTIENGHEVMAIIPENTSLVRIPAANLVVLRPGGQVGNRARAAQVLAGIYFGLQTEIILSRLPKFSRVLLPIVDSELANTIETYLEREPDLDVTLVRFTSSKSSNSIDRTTHAITLRNDASRTEISKAIREDCDVLVNYDLSRQSGSRDSGVATLLSVAKSTNTRVVAFEDIYATEAPMKLLISKLFTDATRLPNLGNNTVVVVKAVDALNNTVSQDTSKTVVVDWSGDQTVRVRAQPLDSRKLFSGRKTYLLVGLTGQMGQSICRWMVQSGARYIVVTSRSPQRDGDWIADLETCGARIDIRAADVTNKKDVTDLVEAISQQMPQVGGVMNGAMLLADGMFADMSYENMSKVLQPKINGSQVLDQVFIDAELDFFIMLSSVNAATGMAGQANYSAANMFMAGLAADRRRRGLTASVVDIGMVIGIGIIQRTEGDAGTGIIETNLRRQNLAPISERDLHHLLAEAIVAGTRDQDVEIITGLQPYISSSPNRPAWYQNSRFSHLVFEDRKAKSSAAGGAAAGKRSVANASNIEEAREILQATLVEYLASELKLSAEDVSPDTPIIDLGVDSLVAAAVRSWLLTEHMADIPVLKILGGASIRQASETASFNIDFSEKKETQVFEKAPPAPAHALKSVAEQHSSNTSPSMSAFSAESVVSTPASSNGDEVEPPHKVEASSIQSLGQSRLYYSSEYLDDISPFNCTTSYRLKGVVDANKLENALNLVIQRNSILRTVFYTDQDSGKAMQAVTNPSRFHLRILQGVDDETDVKAEFKRIHNYPFDLATGDTFIATLLTHGPEYNTLIFGYHHIVLDGVGWQMFLQDLGRCYRDQSTSPSTPNSESCIAFAEKQQAEISGGAFDERLKYWKTVFAEPPKPLPLLPFASVSARRALSRYSMRDTMVSIDSSLIAAIKRTSLAFKVTPFQFWLAGFQVLLRRWLETGDITVGIIDANRTDPTFAQTIGFLLEVLPVRFNVKEDETFTNVLKNTRSAVYGALGNSGVPIEELAKACGVASDRAQTPFTQVIFNYRMGATKTPDMGSCAMEFLDYSDAKVPFDLAISIDEKDDGSGFLTVSAQDYLYDQGSVDLLIATYKHLLSQVAAMPSVSITRVNLNAPALVSQGIELGTGRSIQEKAGLPGTVSKRVSQWISSDPESIAVKDSDENSLTYAELHQRANQIANSLKSVKGFGHKARVAFLCEPFIDISAAILAINRGGAAYIPLDIYASDQRLLDIVEESSSSIILYHSPTALRARHLVGGRKITLINLDETSHEPASDGKDISSPEDIAVILYTSGSTGKPKGVPLTHTNLCTTLSASTQHLSLGREVVLQQTGQGFDAAAWEIMVALTNGGTLIVTDNHRDPAEIADLMKREKVTTSLIMVSEFNTLIQYGQDVLKQCSQWRVAIAAGEQLTTNLVDKVAKLELPSLRLFNGYGPTETSILSTIGEISLSDGFSPGGDYRIPIGSALPGYGMYIVDDNRRALPLGAVGQLAICGKGVAQSGYLGRPELTTAKWQSADFVRNNTDAASKEMDKLCYLTGDRAKMFEDGSFLILGRMEGSSLVKLRGQRVELDEVASCIVESSGGIISDARVVLRQGEASFSHQFLAAFVVLANGHSVLNETEYLQSLIQSLPLANYMRPSVAVSLQKLPFTERGKLDTQKLQDIDLSGLIASTETNDKDEDLNEVERQLKSLWSDIIHGAGGVPLRMTREADFFSVGGNSLLLIRLKAEILRQFNLQVSLSELFKNSTIQHLAARIQGGSESSANLDWDQETEPQTSIPRILTDSSSSHPKSLDLSKGVTILLTGSTGFLGKAILKQLIANPFVKRVHCLAVRDTARFPRQFSSSKVIVHQGDLSKPFLGLADRSTALDIFSQADALIHNGAEVSHMKSYPSLRAANVGSTKEVAQLILQSCDIKKGIPAIHFVSTGGVALLSGLEVLPEAPLPEGSHPSTDGSHGYVASKFASERFLERLQKRVPGLRIGIHRPSNITGDGVGSSDIVHNILRFSKTLGAVPQLGEEFGAFDFIDVDNAAKSILNTVFVDKDEQLSSVVYRHQAGEIVVEADNLRDYLGHSAETPLDITPLNAWVESAVGAGMDELLASFLLETTAGARMPRLASSLTSPVL